MWSESALQYLSGNLKAQAQMDGSCCHWCQWMSNRNSIFGIGYCCVYVFLISTIRWQHHHSFRLKLGYKIQFGFAFLKPSRHLQMSPEELDRIRIRRERNRVAAARCRDRRRMLIDKLQNVRLVFVFLFVLQAMFSHQPHVLSLCFLFQETDLLEHVKTQLEEEISALERERERLELVFEAHMPICKLNELNPE